MSYDRCIVARSKILVTLAFAAALPACAVIDGLGGDGDDSDNGDPPGVEAQCFDGVDDEGDGLQDCEDEECQFDGVCDAFVDCDGGSVPGSCRCVDIFGCDDFSGAGGQFVCHFPAESGPAGVCGPNCFGDNWCPQFGLMCMPDGLCGGSVGGSETGAACLDGEDNDGNGLHDCEESGCSDDPICQGLLGCDAFGDNGGCNCVVDEGCDSVGGAGFFCHQAVGLCGENCLNNDWCIDVGFGCDPGTGQCGMP